MRQFWFNKKRENVIYKMAAIWFKSQCVNTYFHHFKALYYRAFQNILHKTALERVIFYVSKDKSASLITDSINYANFTF